MMQEEWQFCLGLHLHPRQRPLSIPDADADLGMTGLALSMFKGVSCWMNER